MDDRINAYLFDILNAIIELEEFISSCSRDFTKYRADTRTKRAVERNLEIIGEATNRILLIDSDINISNKRKLVDTRNKIIHGYDSISDEIIWGILTNHIPILKKEVLVLLNRQL